MTESNNEDKKWYIRIHIGDKSPEQRTALKEWLNENDFFFQDILLDDHKPNEWDTVRAQNLLRLVESHKKHCKDQSCNISLILMKELYENYIGRAISIKEFESFV